MNKPYSPTLTMSPPFPEYNVRQPFHNEPYLDRKVNVNTVNFYLLYVLPHFHKQYCKALN